MLNVNFKKRISNCHCRPWYWKSLGKSFFLCIEELYKDGSSGRNSALNIPYNEVEFGRALDRGAFGEVYRGVWRGNDVAIKVCMYVALCYLVLKGLVNLYRTLWCGCHCFIRVLIGICLRPDDKGISPGLQERSVCDELLAAP